LLHALTTFFQCELNACFWYQYQQESPTHAVRLVHCASLSSSNCPFMFARNVHTLIRDFFLCDTHDPNTRYDSLDYASMIALNIGFFHTLQSTPSCSTNATVPDQFTTALSTAVQVLGFTVMCGIPFGMVVSACQTEECVRACSPWHHVAMYPAHPPFSNLQNSNGDCQLCLLAAPIRFSQAS
jgi:hypothetical protein